MKCFDRDNESERLWRQFERGRNVLMLAPRRIGKSVLLNRINEEAEKKGFQCVLMDVEGFREERAFFQQMCAALQEELGFGQSLLGALTDRLKRLMAGTEDLADWRQILLNTDWKIFADHLMTQLEADQSGRRWLFLVDEVPIFIKALLESAGPAAAHDFLYTLRKLRNKHPRVLWLYTGSIGLDAIARRSNLEGALVDMQVESIGPFDESIALSFVEHIVDKNRCRLGPGAAAALIDRLGWSLPYYLEKLSDLACDLAGRRQEVSEDHANRAADRMLDLDHRTYWSTWREHIDKNFPDPERTDLFTILNEIALAAKARSIDGILAALNRGGRVVDQAAVQGYLDTLVADGYLVADENRTHYEFRMRLLRDWWRRYVAPRPGPDSPNG